MLQIAPSILASDFSKLGEEIKRIEASGADMVHVDVMDGHFVPNITLGPPVLRCLRPLTQLPFDVHLMISQPDVYLEKFAEAGADSISVHVESCVHLDRTLDAIHALGLKNGVVLNPATPLDSLDYILDKVDMVLLMTVNPGFGGQKYIPGMTRKIRELRETILARGLNVKIQIDGGVGLGNIGEVVRAGVDIVVTGSAFFESAHPAQFVEELRKKGILNG